MWTSDWGGLPTNSVVDGLDLPFCNVGALTLAPLNVEGGTEEGAKEGAGGGGGRRKRRIPLPALWS